MNSIGDQKAHASAKNATLISICGQLFKALQTTGDGNEMEKVLENSSDENKKEAYNEMMVVINDITNAKENVSHQGFVDKFESVMSKYSLGQTYLETLKKLFSEYEE